MTLYPSNAKHKYVGKKKKKKQHEYKIKTGKLTAVKEMFHATQSMPSCLMPISGQLVQPWGEAPQVNKKQ